ncbi:MAG: alpha/beta fold hydrolase [Anaerolineales bacterium]
MSEFFFSQEFRLAFESYGLGTPLVLIHGYPLSRIIWQALIPHLHGLQVILPDVRGFGESQAAEPGFSMDDLAADLESLLDHLHLEQAFIAGHSMGGYIALAFARRAPQRIKGLALIASQAAADPPERRTARLETAERIAREGIGFLAEQMSSALTSQQSLRPQLRALIERQSPKALIGALRAMAERPDATDLLRESTFPLLLLHGQADSLIPIERARQLHALMPRARLIELAAVGHMPMMEAPAETAQALLEWCSSS